MFMDNPSNTFEIESNVAVNFALSPCLIIGAAFVNCALMSIYAVVIRVLTARVPDGKLIVYNVRPQESVVSFLLCSWVSGSLLVNVSQYNQSAHQC